MKPDAHRAAPVRGVILASSSPRRRLLLPLVCPVEEVVAADIDETMRPGESALTVATRLASSKVALIAERAEQRFKDLPVLAADTVVSLDGVPLGKPEDTRQAESMLVALRGRAHEVITAVAVTIPTASAVHVATETTVVLMRKYSDAEIAAYVRRGDPLDKAGAYAIQDAQFRPVDAIQGCFPNVVGLPLCRVAALLGTHGGERATPSTTCQWCKRAASLLTERGFWSPSSGSSTGPA